ncbi:hypothetical protein MMC24_003852 [Lignoscripta atroalba]|nr:hypothetical protein [Lignoscripta atroalba]
MNGTEAVSTPFTFQKLPPEIRTTIYRYALVKTQPILIRRRYPTRSEQFPRSKTRSGTSYSPIPKETRKITAIGSSGLALVLTCRQIYSEAVRVYYGANTFGVYYLPACISFLQAIGTSNQNTITSICLYTQSPAIWSWLSSIPLLRQLEMRITISTHEDLSDALSQLREFCDVSASLEHVHTCHSRVRMTGFGSVHRQMTKDFKRFVLNLNAMLAAKRTVTAVVQPQLL